MHCKLTVRSPDEEKDEILELDTDGITYRRIKRTYHDAGYAIVAEEITRDIPTWVWLIVAVLAALWTLGCVLYLGEVVIR